MKDFLKFIGTCLLILFIAGYWFYKIESNDVYHTKKRIESLTVENQNEAISATDVFSGFVWQSICTVSKDTISNRNVLELSGYIDRDQHSLVPDTFELPYNVHIIFLSGKKIVKVIRIKNPKLFTKNNKSYYLKADEMVKCITKENAVIRSVPMKSNSNLFTTTIEEK